MQLRAKPSEILFATSKPVGLSSKLFILPSGNVMFTIILSSIKKFEVPKVNVCAFGTINLNQK